MNEESPRRLPLVAAFLSVGIHAAILLIGGGLLIRQAEFSVREGGGSTEVELEASSPSEVEEAPMLNREKPQILQTPNAEDVVQPKLQKERTPKPARAEHKPQANPSAATGGGGSLAGSGGQGGSVSAKPDYLRNPVPRYPESARRSHQEGVVTLFVDVGENGEALSVEVKQTSGYKILDAAAVEAVKGWRFKPGTMGGIPVKSRVEIPVRFRLEQE